MYCICRITVWAFKILPPPPESPFLPPGDRKISINPQFLELWEQTLHIHSFPFSPSVLSMKGSTNRKNASKKKKKIVHKFKINISNIKRFQDSKSLDCGNRTSRGYPLTYSVQINKIKLYKLWLHHTFQEYTTGADTTCNPTLPLSPPVSWFMFCDFAWRCFFLFFFEIWTHTEDDWHGWQQRHKKK